jgi:hypothetical protein
VKEFVLENLASLPADQPLEGMIDRSWSQGELWPG